MEQKYSLKSDRWTKIQLEELQDNIVFLTERVDDLKCLMSRETKNYLQKVNAMVKRTQSRLINESRLSKRKLGAGRNLSSDEEDETFILRCIGNKTTAHGKRHDAVMYLHHRIKKADLLNLANFNRISRGLPTIKSSTTVYNRSRPKTILSRQAKSHLGKGLFCTKKPPKAETMQNELTHHQRAHRKNIQLWMWGEKNSDGHEYTFEISKDDKAYICPGTSTGMRSARNQTIIQPSNEEIAKKLPKYDFPFSMVNVTPATHRYMTESHKLVNEKNEISILDDDTIVFSRPKHFVGGKVVV